MTNDEMINVRYMVDDVDESIAFYTKHLGFEPLTNAAPAFADVKRGNLRLLLAGPKSSAGRPMPDGRTPGPGHDVVAERCAGLAEPGDFRVDVVDDEVDAVPASWPGCAAVGHGTTRAARIE